MENSIHKKLKLARKEAGLNQIQVAELVGRTQGQVSMWETDPSFGDNAKGKSTKPSFADICKLAEIYNKPISYFSDDNMDFSLKLRQFRQNAGKSQVELAEYIGVTQPVVVQYEQGKAKPKIDKLYKIAEFLEIPISELLDEIDNNGLKNEFTKIENSKEMITLDKLDIRAGAGSEGLLDSELFNSSSKITFDKQLFKRIDYKNLKVIEIIGDSMQPEFYEGDLAIIDMVNHRYDFVKIAGIYIVRVGEIVYIKRVEFLPQGEVRLISLNPNYGDIYPLKNGYDFEIIGKVCGRIQIQKGLVFNNQGIK